jgi:hypothetical protein
MKSKLPSQHCSKGEPEADSRYRDFHQQSERATAMRCPCHQFWEFAAAGGLMSYGGSITIRVLSSSVGLQSMARRR